MRGAISSDGVCPPQFELLIYPEAGLQAEQSAPLWIVVLSVLAGLLLLALICLLLWKVSCSVLFFSGVSRGGEK